MKRILSVTVIITILVWASGFFGFDGIVHTLLVLSLIILCLILIFVGIVREDNFL